MKRVDFTKSDGLVPAIVQDAETSEILMLGYIDDQALKQTLATGWVWFWSRSKQRLWMKGESSGDRLAVRDIWVDCDNDTLLIKAQQTGSATCHTGNKTCFHTKIVEEDITLS